MAKFETKLNVGDSAYYIENNKIKEGEVEKINITISYDVYYVTTSTEVSYTLKDGEKKTIKEEDIFPTIEELLEHLKHQFIGEKAPRYL